MSTTPDWSRILIVRLGSLGDIVHALPAAAALRDAMPAARIDWIVDARHAELLDLVPIVDRVVVVGDRSRTEDETSFRGRPIAVPASGPLDAIRLLRRERYDAALDFQGLLKSGAIAWLSGARCVAGFTRARLREPMARWFYTTAVDPGAEPGGHVVFKNLGLIRSLGVPTTGVRFPLDRRETPVVGAARERLAIGGGDSFVVLNPGGGWPNKRWPPERFGRLAREIARRWSLKSIVPWGPGEESLARQVVERSDGAAAEAPRTSLTDLIALASACALMVSGDTGPLHLAAAVGTPLVGLYGPTSPARNGPWRTEDVTVSRFAACGCHHLRACRQRDWCLLDISVDEVADAVARRLAASGRHG